MDKLLKLEKYQLLHNSIYWCGMIGIFILGFFTADTYVTEVMGPTEEIASSLADIFNGMVYDSTFLLIIMSAILALILGQEFSKRTINLEVSAGHSRKQIFTSKIISYLIAFNLMALVYPVSGCIREFGRFGVADVGMFFYNIIKAIIYSCLLNSAIFLIAILICCYLQDAVKATSVTAIIISWLWNDVEITSRFFTYLSNQNRCQHENLFSTDSYFSRMYMVWYIGIAFVDKIL